jgi:ribosome-binding factor A
MKRRILQINKLLQEEVGKIILREVDLPDALVTITRAETSSDMLYANIFVSVLPEKEAEKVVHILEKRAYFIQRKINKILKMKFVPRIRFRGEDKTKEAGKIEDIFAKIEKEDPTIFETD